MFVALLTYLGRRSKGVILSLAMALVAVIAAIDYWTGIELSLSVFYLLPVALAAWFASRGSALAISVFSAVAWFVTDLLAAPEYDLPFAPYWNAAVRLGIFWLVTLMLGKIRELVRHELIMAAEIQQAFLPDSLPKFQGLEIAASLKPALAVSGDYYDVLKFSEHETGFCVADVVGHGMPAALLMSSLQAAVKLLASNRLPPEELSARLNEVICRNTTAGRFITFFYGQLDLRTRKLTYVNAGHNPPILLHADGTYELLEPCNPVLGVEPNWQFTAREVTLKSGDRLILFTDGVTELQNPVGEEFGVHRLLELVRDRTSLSADALHKLILRKLESYSKGIFPDDITLMILAVE